MSVGGVGGGRVGPVGPGDGTDTVGATTTTGGATVGFGARGDAVRAIQTKLLAAGFDVGAADGIYGRGTERAVADLQRRSGLPATGTVDAATSQALTSRAGPRIWNSVGVHGRNDPVDVRAVQRKLQGLGFYRGDIDGISGPQLATAIRLFDGVVRGAEALDGAGAAGNAARTLAPGETADLWLRAANAPRWEKMPREGTGFRNVDTEGHDWGASWLADTVRGAGAAYQASYRGAHPGALPIQTNDASWRRGGDTDDHETHETGLDLDLRLGPRPGMTFRSAGYDREAVWAQMKAFLDQPNVERIIFNDPVILQRANADARYAGRVATDPEGVHDNHFHVDVRPPAIR